MSKGRARAADLNIAAMRLGGVLSQTEDQKADVDAVWIRDHQSVIHPDPLQPRQYFAPEELRELGNAMRLHQQPGIIVRPYPGRAGHYIIVAGERRWRAAGPDYGNLELLRVSVQSLNASEAIFVQWAENRLREELAPIARGRGMRRLKMASPVAVLPDYNGEVHRELTWDEVAKLEGLTGERSALRYVALLKLPQEIQYEMEKHKLSEKHGRALLKLQPAGRDCSGKDELGNAIKPFKNQKTLLRVILDSLSGDTLRKPMRGEDALERADKLIEQFPDEHDLALLKVARKATSTLKEERRQQEADVLKQQGKAPLRDVGGGSGGGSNGGGSKSGDEGTTPQPPNTPPNTSANTPTSSGGSGFVQAEANNAHNAPGGISWGRTVAPSVSSPSEAAATTQAPEDSQQRENAQETSRVQEGLEILSSHEVNFVFQEMRELHDNFVEMKNGLVARMAVVASLPTGPVGITQETCHILNEVEALSGDLHEQVSALIKFVQTKARP